MMRHLLFFIFIIGSVYYYWENRSVTHGPGMVAPDPPVQEEVSDKSEIRFKNFTLLPQAKIRFEGRILAIKTYYFDTFSNLTATDVVFSWEAMSDERNLNTLMVRQEDRSFYWEMTKPPISKPQMWEQAANMHLIGPTEEMRDKINSLRKGHVVQVEGLLVNAESSKGWSLKTSLSRDDIGDGSSELLWIQKLNIL